MDAKEVGKRIQYFRESKNIKKNALANAAGVSPTYINDIERGDKCPTVEYLSYIVCDGLKMTLTEFFADINLTVENDKLSELTPAQKQLLNQFLNSLK